MAPSMALSTAVPRTTLCAGCWCGALLTCLPRRQGSQCVMLLSQNTLELASSTRVIRQPGLSQLVPARPRSAIRGARRGVRVCAMSRAVHLDSVALARNGAVVPCDLQAGPWLAQSPRGAYTTARTVGGARVFELSLHISRLAKSISLMMQADCDEHKPGAQECVHAFGHLSDPQRLRPLVIASLSAAIASYRQAEAAAQQATYAAPQLGTLLASQQPAAPAAAALAGLAAAATADTGTTAAAVARLQLAEHPAAGQEEAVVLAPAELKLTVLVTWNQESADVFAHVSPLPPRPRPPVKVQVRGAPRANALAKDSEWVKQRQALEAAKPADVNEVLLAEPCGAVLEGMSSNFFAVLGGAVHTAGEGVLEGTVRQVALDVAAREGIPVVLQPPSLKDLDRWEGAFISSTSRLLLPVDELEVPEWQGEPRHARWARGGVVAAHLEQLVFLEVEARSEALAEG